MTDIDLLEIKANAERLETTLKNLGLYVQGVNDAMGQMDKTISDVLTPEALNRYIHKVEAAYDSTKKLEEIFNDSKVNASEQIERLSSNVEDLRGTSNILHEMFDKGSIFLDKINQLKDLQQTIGNIQDLSSSLSEAENINEKLNQAVKSGEDVSNVLEKLVFIGETIEYMLGEMKVWQKTVCSDLDVYAQVKSELLSGMEQHQKDMKRFVGQLQQIRDEICLGGEIIESLRKSIDQVAACRGQLGHIFEELQEVQKANSADMLAKMDSIRSLHKLFIKNEQEFLEQAVEARDSLGEKLHQNQSALKSFLAEWKSLQQAVGEMGSCLDELRGSMASAAYSKDKFSDLFQEIRAGQQENAVLLQKDIEGVHDLIDGLQENIRKHAELKSFMEDCQSQVMAFLRDAFEDSTLSRNMIEQEAELKRQRKFLLILMVAVLISLLLNGIILLNINNKDNNADAVSVQEVQAISLLHDEWFLV